MTRAEIQAVCGHLWSEYYAAERRERDRMNNEGANYYRNVAAVIENLEQLLTSKRPSKVRARRRIIEKRLTQKASA